MASIRFEKAFVARKCCLMVNGKFSNENTRTHCIHTHTHEQNAHTVNRSLSQFTLTLELIGDVDRFDR